MTTLTTASTTTTAALVGHGDGVNLLNKFKSMPMAMPIAAPASAAGCPQCGFDLPPTHHDGDGDAQQRISELEAQVRYLNKRAAETAEKLADYEDEIRFLRSQAHSHATATATNTSTTDPTALPTTPTLSPSQPTASTSSSPSRPQQQQQQQQPTATPPQPPSQPQSRLGIGTFASLLPYRRNTSTPPPAPPPAPSQPPPPQSPTPSLDIQSALSHEHSLRIAAESRLTQTTSELEELTAQLFSQANEMVAAERKARAKLEERVEVLERRDGEKRRRLERLESAVERVGRVRGLVG
ncbi:hypothetical protein FQN50_005074 [Emmonsiellopsis sp. PD_5]|nr:hypothetical protein FQN50_005074 [Emmonsiellopsis sp. PD_5]